MKDFVEDAVKEPVENSKEQTLVNSAPEEPST